MAMGLLSPTPPPYDPVVWDRLPLPEKLKQVCTAWAVQGYGTPLYVVALYGLKVLAYVAGWAWFCTLSPALGSIDDIGTWWAHPVAFEKAILWSLLFEVLGLGCGSGPLTGRYLPPVGGFLYFLRPGTTKLPLLRGVPYLGGHRRTVVDVALYAALLAVGFAALVSADPRVGDWLAIVILLAVIGLFDTTVFLAARSEHYWMTAICFAFSPAPLAAAMAVQASLWFFAGFSKLNHHFPAVVCVMTSNSPVTFPALRKLMYRSYPDDLRPSRFAAWSGHAGTLLELSIPLVLLAGDGEFVTIVGLGMMVFLHVFITSNVPMGVPLEWNVMVVYGAFVLFWGHPNLHLVDVGWPVGVVLLLCCVGLPLLGNTVPRLVSFLVSMRYYAGNWAHSVWLFEGDSHRKLDRLTKSAPWIFDQLELVYPRSTSVGLVGRVLAFRSMHLHGRVLATLVPRVTEGREGDYLWLDGELVAGLALGWNFGDGHLHDERLLEALQAQCGFEPGEVRCVFVESQPVQRQELVWRIADAATGEIARGTVSVAELREVQPWETIESLRGSPEPLGGLRAGQRRTIERP